MMTLSLAVRNLLRNRRRSVATLLALAIGAASILLFGGYSANIRYSLLTAYVTAGGHLQIQHADFYQYGSGNPSAYGLADYERVLQGIRQDPALRDMVNVVSPTLQFGGIAGNFDAGVSRTVVGIGFAPDDINRMRQWNEYNLPIEPPHFALEGAPPDTAIVGLGVARVLLLCEPLKVGNCPSPQAAEKATGARLPDDIAALSGLEDGANKKQAAAGPTKARIELLAGHGRGTPNVAALQVLQAENQGFKELDDVAVILQLKQAQQLVYGRAAPRATALMVQLHRTQDMPAATQALKALLARLVPGQPWTVMDFETLNPFYVQTLQLFDTIFGFIFALIGGIVLFTVGNTMNAAVTERTVEIGTLRSVGLRQAGIRSLFVTEGLLLGVAGAVLGVTSALLIATVLNRMGLTWLPPGSSDALPLTLRVWGETRMIVGTAIGLVVIAALSAWWPAYRAANLKIVEALRHA